jgi:hypothetical protein
LSHCTVQYVKPPTASSWISSAVRPPEQTVEKTATFCRDTSNSSKNLQVAHSATAAETIGKSQTSTAGGRLATAKLPEIVEISQQQ